MTFSLDCGCDADYAVSSSLSKLEPNMASTYLFVRVLISIMRFKVSDETSEYILLHAPPWGSELINWVWLGSPTRVTSKSSKLYLLRNPCALWLRYQLRTKTLWKLAVHTTLSEPRCLDTRRHRSWYALKPNAVKPKKLTDHSKWMHSHPAQHALENCLYCSGLEKTDWRKIYTALCSTRTMKTRLTARLTYNQCIMCSLRNLS